MVSACRRRRRRHPHRGRLTSGIRGPPWHRMIPWGSPYARRLFRKVHPAWVQSRMDHADAGGTGHPHAREHGRGVRPAARVVEQSRLARLPHVPAGVPCGPWLAGRVHAPRSARPCDDEDAQPVVGRAYVRRLPRLVGRRESVHVAVGRAAVAQAGLFGESGASGPAPVVLVADGWGGEESADVLGYDERWPEDADALRVVEPQAGACAAFQSGAASGGGYALAAEAARHDVHVAQGVPVYPGGCPSGWGCRGIGGRVRRMGRRLCRRRRRAVCRPAPVGRPCRVRRSRRRGLS